MKHVRGAPMHKLELDGETINAARHRIIDAFTAQLVPNGLPTAIAMLSLSAQFFGDNTTRTEFMLAAEEMWRVFGEPEP
jgi:hypothetical protein